MALNSSSLVCKYLAEEQKDAKIDRFESSSSIIIELAKSERHSSELDSKPRCFDCVAAWRHPNPATMPNDIPQDLRFLGSQFSAAAEEIKKYTYTKEEEKEHQSCPYHYHIFQNFAEVSVTRKNLDILERYILKDPANQYAIFYQIETEQPSISRDCTCYLVHGLQI